MGNQPSNGAAGQPPGGVPGPGQGGQQQQQQHMQQQGGGQQYGGGRQDQMGYAAGYNAAPPSPQQQQQQQYGGQQGQMGGGGSQGGQQDAMAMEDGGIPLDMASLTAADDDMVPTVFRWEHGGRQVYITGTFNGWSRQIPMHRSGNDFTYIHNLKRGKHAFKFIVDDEWRFAPDQPTVADIEGRINNFIDVTEFKAYTGDRDFEREKEAADYGVAAVHHPLPGQEGQEEEDVGPGGSNVDVTGGEAGKDGIPGGPPGSAPKDPDGETFGHTVPDLDDYTKEPPPLPPHLRHIILNKPPQLQDTAALPVPQHVALNHLYCTAIKDNMMVLGITQRYKTKFVTTVYYSPCT